LSKKISTETTGVAADLIKLIDNKDKREK